MAPELDRTLMRLAESRWPREACGAVLRGRGGLVAVELSNVSSRPWREFEADPGELARLLAHAGEGALVGLWHSHPGAPLDSAADRARSLGPDGAPLWPGVARGVVALRDGLATAVRWSGRPPGGE